MKIELYEASWNWLRFIGIIVLICALIVGFKKLVEWVAKK